MALADGSTIRVASAGSRMSPATSEQRSPISAAGLASTSSRRPAITTCAPAAASSIAACLPRLVPPPVTSTTRPASASGAKICEAGGVKGERGSRDRTRLHGFGDHHVPINQSPSAAIVAF